MLSLLWLTQFDSAALFRSLCVSALISYGHVCWLCSGLFNYAYHVLLPKSIVNEHLNLHFTEYSAMYTSRLGLLCWFSASGKVYRNVRVCWLKMSSDCSSSLFPSIGCWIRLCFSVVENDCTYIKLSNCLYSSSQSILHVKTGWLHVLAYTVFLKKLPSNMQLQKTRNVFNKISFGHVGVSEWLETRLAFCKQLHLEDVSTKLGRLNWCDCWFWSTKSPFTLFVFYP
jgi:hypothetical protein